MAWREEVREGLVRWGWRPERVVKRGCGGGRDNGVCGSSSIIRGSGGSASVKRGGMAADKGDGVIGLLDFVVMLLARLSSNGGLEAALSISCISKLLR